MNDRPSDDVGLDVDRIARGQRGQRGPIERCGNQRDRNVAVLDGRQRERHAVDRDGSLGNHIRPQAGLRTQPDNVLAWVGHDPCDARSAIHVTLYEVAIEPRADLEGSFQIDAIAGFVGSERALLERLGNNVEHERLSGPFGDRQTHAADAHAGARFATIGERTDIDTETAPARCGSALADTSDGFDDSRKHGSRSVHLRVERVAILLLC